jgi:hypothetical protein
MNKGKAVEVKEYPTLGKNANALIDPLKYEVISLVGKVMQTVA